MSLRSEELYIKDILDAIAHIEEYTKGISFFEIFKESDDY